MDGRDLYGLALERFIPERASLVKTLRGEKRREDAARVAALRKPSVAAWAVNQLVRTQGQAISRLFDAGDALIAAQSQLLTGGGDPRTLRDATGRERAAVYELTEIARGLLSSAGQELSAVTLERVGETLRAAALDEHTRASVKDGCLVRELQHVGLGDAGVFVVAEPKPVATEAPPARVLTKSTAAAEAAARKAQVAARQAAAAARRLAERAARDLAAAESKRDGAAAALAEADAALRLASERAVQADEALRAAERALGGM